MTPLGHFTTLWAMGLLHCLLKRLLQNFVWLVADDSEIPRDSCRGVMTELFTFYRVLVTLLVILVPFLPQ
jgi:hypothetical protein